MEPSLQTSLAEQLPVVMIVLVAMVLLLREFKSYLKELNQQHSQDAKDRDKDWQGFIREQRQADQKIISDVVSEIKNLALEIKNLRGDFDKAVTRMDERTRPERRRSKSQPDD